MRSHFQPEFFTVCTVVRRRKGAADSIVFFKYCGFHAGLHTVKSKTEAANTTADNNNIVLHHNRKRIFSTTFKKQELPQHSKTAIYARQLQKLLVQFSEIRQEISNKTRACREMTIRSCRVST